MGTVQQKLEKILGTKEAIRQAIAAKGQTIPESTVFSAYPAKISAIQTGVDTGDATAGAGDILSGKTAYAKGAKVTGSIPSVTHPSPTLSRSGGTITASHTQGAGYTSGGTTTGTLTIPTQAGKTVTPGTSLQTAVASGRLTTGAVYVAGDSNLKAENIKAGVSIFGVAGSAAVVSEASTLTIINNSSVDAILNHYKIINGEITYRFEYIYAKSSKTLSNLVTFTMADLVPAYQNVNWGDNTGNFSDQTWAYAVSTDRYQVKLFQGSCTVTIRY